MMWLWLLVGATIVAMILEVVRFKKKIASCSRTEAMRRLLNVERTASQPPHTPTRPGSRTAP